MTIETASTMPPARKVRQLTPSELDAQYPIDCSIDAKGVVRVSRTWEQANLVRIKFPASFGIQSGFMLHKLAVPHFQAWFDLIVRAGLKRDIATFNGSYVPRLKRGENVPKTRAGLSRHARGLAIDLNAGWNRMGDQPAGLKDFGTVLRIAPLAQQAGLVWGGDWHGASIDPQHFEIGTTEP